MGALQQSLELPALVARLTAANTARDAVAARAKELMDAELLAMADDLTNHPEIGFKETRSVKILTDYLRRTTSTSPWGWLVSRRHSSPNTAKARRAPTWA